MNIILTLMIYLWFLGIVDIYCAIASSEVNINDNITEKAYSNDINLTCSFTLLQGYDLFSIALKTSQNATPGNFEEIAGYLRSYKPEFTSFGMELFGNETSFIHFDENQNTFVLAFNNLTCRHERRYKCVLYVIRRPSVTPILVESHTMWISVTVLPAKPSMNIPAKANELSRSKRNTRSVTLPQTNDTHGMCFIEGDNITFMCEGDVGRPEGRFVWQKIDSSERKFYYPNISTETIPESCSYLGNSTLTIQVTGDDNQARIRCIVKSELPNGTKHVDSEPLLIHFKVRRPFIELFPNKTVFQEGDSVQLNCKANGNPNPTYSWTKENSSGEVIVYNDTLVINKANISDSGLYTCDTSNSIDGTEYFESMSTYIKIENISTTPSSATINPLGTDNTQVEVFTSIFGTVAFLIIGICIGICVLKIKNSRSKKLIESKDINIIKACYPASPAKSEQGNYNSVVDGGSPVETSKSSGCDHDEVEIKIDKENMYNQKKGEENINTLKENDKPVDKSELHTDITESPKTAREVPPTENTKGYEYVDLDDTDMKFKPLSNEVLKQHNDEHLKKQQEDKDKEKDDRTIPNDGAVYASVSKPKNKQTTENKNPANQQEDDLYEESKEGIYDQTGNRRHKEIHAGHYGTTEPLKKEDSKSGLEMDLIDPQKTGRRVPSTNITNNTLRNAGYEDVDLDNTDMKFKPLNNEETIDKVNQQNDEHFKKQKEDTDKEKDNSRTPPFEGVVYSSVSKPKNKQTTENKSPADQQEDDLYEESKKGIDETSGDKENHATDHDTTDTSEHLDHDEAQSLLKGSQIACSFNKSYAHGCREKSKVAIVSPSLRSLASSGNNGNAESQKGIHGRSRQTLDTVEYVEKHPFYLRKQQTIGDLESSIKSNQIGSYINPVYELEEVDPCSPPLRSFGGIHDGRQINQNSEQQ